MLRGLFTGELRQGAQAGLLVEAIASLTGVINIGKGMLAAAYCKEGPLKMA